MKAIGDSLPRRFKAKASGAITAGKPLIVEADGDVAQVVEAQIVGSPATFESATIELGTSIAFDSSNNKVVIGYRDAGNSGYGTAVVATVSGSSITYGTPVVFASASTDGPSGTFDSNSNKVVFCFTDSANSKHGTAIVGTVSGDSISFGSEAVFESDDSRITAIGFDSSNNKVVIAFRDHNDSKYGKAVVGTVSSTSISFGSVTTFESAQTSNHNVVFDSSNNKIVICYSDVGNSFYPTAIVGTVSGTSISFGTAVVADSNGATSLSATFDSNSNKVVMGLGSSSAGAGIVGTVSGTSISFGTKASFASASSDVNGSGFDTSTNKVTFTFADGGNSDYGTLVIGTVSGTDITFAAEQTFETGGTTQYMRVVFDSSANRFVVAYRQTSDNYGKALAFSGGAATNLTSENYIGIAEYAAADTETATVFIKGGVSTPGGTALDPPTAGTAVEFESGITTGPPSVVYDSSNNKVVIAYKDASDSNKGKAIVGTVSGDTISFGTAVEFEAGNTSNISIAFDSNSNKVVIAYRDGGNSNYGTAIVGTVSGTSISFGTAVVFESAAVAYTATVFDSSSNKIVIGYRDGGNSDQATAIVGTVSGTSISFGTAVVFEAGTVVEFGATFDSANGKVVFAYKDGGDSSKGKAIVGTVSDTSISFGTAVGFSGTDAVNKVAATFDSSNGKVVIAYNNDTDSNSEAIVGTVSGTSISFGTAVEVSSTDNNSLYRMAFNDTQNTVFLAFMENSTEDLEVFVGTVSGTSISFGTSVKAAEHVPSEGYGIAYDSNAKRLVAAYHDDDDSNKGKAVTVASEFTVTPGQTYFVQGDGTLGLTADSPSVTAGTAVTSTKLIVKG